MVDPQVGRPGRRTASRLRSRSAGRQSALGVAPLSPLAGGGEWCGRVELNTAHCTIAVVDVEGFGRHSRTTPNRLRIRGGMYGALEQAFAAAGISWSACRCTDLGDGVLVLGPAYIRKAPFADRLPGALIEELIAHNRAHPPEERIRLRLALHAGEVTSDDHGVTGSSILHAQRLLDAPVLKRALANTTAVLAVIASSWFFEEVVRQTEGGQAAAYSPAAVAGGYLPATAWIRLLAASPVARRRDLRRRRRAG